MSTGFADSTRNDWSLAIPQSGRSTPSSFHPTIARVGSPETAFTSTSVKRRKPLPLTDSQFSGVSSVPASPVLAGSKTTSIARHCGPKVTGITVAAFTVRVR